MKRTERLLCLVVCLVNTKIGGTSKRGFEVPLVRWLRGELRDMTADVILSRSGLLAELFDRAALEALLRGDGGLDPARWSRRVWLLLMLGMWDRHVHSEASIGAVRIASLGT